MIIYLLNKISGKGISNDIPLPILHYSFLRNRRKTEENSSLSILSKSV